MLEIELFWHLNCILMLESIVWNSPVICIIMHNGWCAIKPNQIKSYTA